MTPPFAKIVNEYLRRDPERRAQAMRRANTSLKKAA
jgi:hypothetical protein